MAAQFSAAGMKGIEMATFNSVKITAKTIMATREHFAANRHACIAEVQSGELKVNDPAEYVRWMLEMAQEDMEGRHDHTLTFLQRAYWLQTGDMIALLP